MAKSKLTKQLDAITRAEEHGRSLQQRLTKAQQDHAKAVATPAADYAIMGLSNGRPKVRHSGDSVKDSVLHGTSRLIRSLKEDIERNADHIRHLNTVVAKSKEWGNGQHT